MSLSDYKKISDAAYDWAWHKKWTVEVYKYQVAYDMWEVEVELTSKFRDRDFA